MEGEYGTFMIYLIFVILNMFAVWASRETSWSKLGLSAEFQLHVQNFNLGGNMNVSSCWSITNVKIYCRQICCPVYLQFSQVRFALKHEFCFQIQCSLRTLNRLQSLDFEYGLQYRIIPFLIKILVFNCFRQYRKAKNSNLGTKLFTPKGSNRFHYWAALSPDIISHNLSNGNIDDQLKALGRRSARNMLVSPALIL